jgi:hypothetical protein
MLALFLILLSVSLSLGFMVVRGHRQRIKFLLSPRAIAMCDVKGCKHEPRFNISDDNWVCACHL